MFFLAKNDGNPYESKDLGLYNRTFICNVKKFFITVFLPEACKAKPKVSQPAYSEDIPFRGRGQPC